MVSESYVGEGRCLSYLTDGAVGSLTRGPNRPHISYATAPAVKSLKLSPLENKLLSGPAGHWWVDSVN